MIKKVYLWFHRRVTKVEEKGQPSAGVWHNKIREETMRICEDYKGRFLEVGCGEGLFIAQLAAFNSQLEITGVDNNIEKLSDAEEKCEAEQCKNVRIVHADATKLPFESEYFCNIVCINVLLNLESMNLANNILAEISRVCKKGGRLIFDFRNSLNLLLRLKYKLAPYYDITVKEQKLPLNTYGLKQIERLLDELGLKIINRIYLGFPYNKFAPIVIIEAEKC